VKRLAISAALFILAAAHNADAGKTVSIQSDRLRVELADEFPRVVSYTWTENDAVIHGQEDALSEITLNGTNYAPQVKLSAGSDNAVYALDMAELKLAMKVTFRVQGNVLHFDVTDIVEKGGFVLRTFAIPDHALISVRSTQPGAFLAANLVPKGDLEMVAVKDRAADAKPVDRSYVILGTDKLAATIYNNVLLDQKRIVHQTLEKDGYKRCASWSPLWTYREIPTEIYELPMCRVVINADVNEDGKVDWQDGALSYRQAMKVPFGAEHVPGTVCSQIAMNFASWAQHPFLRILDNCKKIYLFTDGMGQDIQFKGYQSEGHDSAHPDYGGNVNRRAGGLEELNFVMKRMADFNARPGVHINATEYHKEAKHFDLELVNTNKIGWCWLDESYYTDKRYDILSGKLYQRIDEMAAELDYLKWVYVDVYFGKGWDAHKIVSRLQHHGLAVYTEFEGIMEREATWIHRPEKPAGLGVMGRIPRFIQNHMKDVWLHEPMLRGAYNYGFMGWHTERNVDDCMHVIYAINLPTKYMQHFPVLRWEDNRIDLEGGVTVKTEGDLVTLSRNGKLRAVAEYTGKKRKPRKNRLFIPWSPGKPVKAYHWNDGGGETTWALPETWSGAEQVRLYRLSDRGRTFVRLLSVSGGNITIDARAMTPYVVYKNAPAPPREIVWGEGAIVKDPGFDSYGFDYWTRTSSSKDLNHVHILADAKGQTHLRVKGNDGADATVSQVLFGLEGGKTYSASVWVELTGERTAAIGVRAFKGFAPAAELPKDKWTVIHVDSEEPAESAGGGLGASAIDGEPSTYWHTEWARRKPAHPHEVQIDLGETVQVDGFTYLPRPGHGNGTIKEYAIHAGMSSENWWPPIAEGTFKGEKTVNGKYLVRLGKSVAARYVRFVALSEFADQPFASAAEFGVLGRSAGKKAEKPAFAEVRSEVKKTNVRNYGDNSAKYLTNYQRIKVLFDVPKGIDKAELYIQASEGAPDSIADFDDVRVVETKRTDQGGHYFFEDFENIDEGWGPFVYGFKGSMRVHLAETHKPYTSDTLSGDFSLKSMEATPALNFRSLPALLPFASNAQYRLSFDYLCDVSEQFSVILATDEGGKDAEVLRKPLPGEKRTHNTFTATFTTGPHDDYYIGFVKNVKGKGILSIDNVTVDIVK